jgi:1-acyl-sn-glycerol-3-phosphate acyltransferase
VIRSLLAHLFWIIATPLAAIVAIPRAFITGNVMPLYRTGSWIGWTGIVIAGVRVDVEGLDRLDPQATYVFMSNHTSNLDPPILLPLIPRRTSVLVKKELFRIPVFGRAMRMTSLVPVDRTNREKAIESLRAGCDVLRAGINMMVFAEGTRSRDGRLLPFKKGPFYMAMETGVPIVPVTIVGTHELQPKGQMLSRPGVVRVIFHEPVNPCALGDRDVLVAKVRETIASALPESQR